MSVVAALAGKRSHVGVLPRSEAATSAKRLVASAGWAGVCALVVVAPYEALRPLVRLPGQSLTSVEAALLAVLGAWTLGSVAWRVSPDWRTPLTLPLALFVGLSAVSALVAPRDRINALHMTGRLALALALFVLTVATTNSPARIRGVIRAATFSAVVVSVLVILEYVGAAAAREGLNYFRPAVAFVGAQVRASGPLQYPTIASMFLEICFALGLGLLAEVAHSRRFWSASMMVVSLAVIGEAVVLTFSRSGLVTVAMSLAVVAGAQLRDRRRRRSLVAIGVVALAVGLEVLSSQSAEAMRVRLTTENQDRWFRAGFVVPPVLTLQTGERVAVPVRLTNTGRITWDPKASLPFRLSYHWLEAQTDRVVIWEGARTELPEPVVPGASVSIDAVVSAPGEPGEFRLVWDIEQVQRLWFSTEPGAVAAFTDAVVAGPIVIPPSAVSPTPGPAYMPRAAVRPGRVLLWSAALRMIGAHPIAGVGPDNFRLQYGAYAGLAKADPRLHSNNMYLELLVGTGLLGGLALIWIGRRLLSVLVLLFRADLMAASGVAAAIVAIAVHGCFDTFLGFTPTYILMAIAMALAALASRSSDANAHRI